MTEISDRPVTAGANGEPSCTVFRHGQPARRQDNLTDISEILDEPGALVWFDVVALGVGSELMALIILFWFFKRKGWF